MSASVQRRVGSASRSSRRGRSHSGGVPAGFQWSASTTRPVAGQQGVLSRREEGDILRSGLPGRACRTAEDACRVDARNEDAVVGRVTRHEGLKHDRCGWKIMCIHARKLTTWESSLYRNSCIEFVQGKLLPSFQPTFAAARGLPDRVRVRCAVSVQRRRR